MHEHMRVPRPSIGGNLGIDPPPANLQVRLQIEHPERELVLIFCCQLQSRDIILHRIIPQECRFDCYLASLVCGAPCC